MNPRREASVFQHGDLTEEQQEAAHRVQRLLDGMLAEQARDDTKPEHPSARHLSFLPVIDKRRTSHVALIEGARGSGKTSLLLSLIDQWNDALRAERAESRLIPVMHLDLHPLPAGTSLLVYITNQLGRVVDALEEQTAPRCERAAWQLGHSDDRESRRCWRKLQRCAVLGWDSNIRQLKAQLDTDAYLIEQEQAVREQRVFEGCWRAFLSALSKEFATVHSRDSSGRVLFVISVDDADMNPQRTVELLDLLRMLWHPQLAFVLTGDSKLFLRTLQTHLAGVLLEPVQGKRLSEQDDVEDWAARLAREIYDKVIPPAQRFELPPLDPSARLQNRRAPLLGELSKVEVSPIKRPLISLASYFLTHPQFLEALPDRLRGLLDLGKLLGEWNRQDQEPERQRMPHAANGVVLQLWESALAMQATGQAALRDLRQRAVRLEQGAICVEVTGNSLELAGVRSTGSTLATAVNPQVPSRLITILHQFHIELKTPGGFRLEGSVAAALLLAANVAADQANGRLIASPSGDSGFLPYLARVDHGGVALGFAWPVPPRLSPLELAVLTYRWSEGLRPLRDKRGRVAPDSAAKLLVRVVLTLTNVPLGTLDTWDELAGAARMVSLRPDNDPSSLSVALRRWALCRAGLLAAPEGGLSDGEAGDWIGALKMHFTERHGAELVAALKRERLRHARFVLGEALTAADLDVVGSHPGAEELLQRIDAQHPGHPWHAFMKQAAPPASPSPAERAAPAEHSKPAKGKGKPPRSPKSPKAGA